jgi:hypothetical protein
MDKAFALFGGDGDAGAVILRRAKTSAPGINQETDRAAAIPERDLRDIRVPLRSKADEEGEEIGASE